MTATAQVAGLRLDKALAVLLPHLSRGRTRSWIEAGAVTLNGAPARPRATVLAGDRIDLVEVPSAQEQAFRAEPMALEVVHADPSILVLHKPAGLVVHPAPGHWSGTLLNGLLAYDPALGQLPRAGIVHRLDADTSGLMVVARNAEAQLALVRQLQQRTMTREYWAVVHGTVPPTGTIDAAIGRDRRNPLRFSVAPGSTSKAARTGYRRAGTATFGTTPGSASVSWVVCRLETGRTHQIRVHLESIGHPLVGDRLYRAGRPPVPAAAGKPTPAWSTFPRQALHACRLQLAHPASGEPLGWFAPPPADMTRLMTDLGWRGLDRPQSEVE
jgi:23S rRNA pseudouridine1911/1915/1917 synthase